MKSILGSYDFNTKEYKNINARISGRADGECSNYYQANTNKRKYVYKLKQINLGWKIQLFKETYLWSVFSPPFPRVWNIPWIKRWCISDGETVWSIKKLEITCVFLCYQCLLIRRSCLWRNRSYFGCINIYSCKRLITLNA